MRAGISYLPDWGLSRLAPGGSTGVSMSILDDARAGQNVLEKLMNAIPGFKGYRDKELRRDADKLLRESLAARLDEGKKSLNDLAQAATRGGSLDVINDVETARKRLDKVANRIRYADRGYAGLFAAVKVQEDKLEQAYQFDLALADGVDAARGRAAEAVAAPDKAAALRLLIDELDALDGRVTERENILAGVR